MSESLLEPEWEQIGVPVDDDAEPDDADVGHFAGEYRSFHAHEQKPSRLSRLINFFREG